MWLSVVFLCFSPTLVCWFSARTSLCNAAYSLPACRAISTPGSCPASFHLSRRPCLRKRRSSVLWTPVTCTWVRPPATLDDFAFLMDTQPSPGLPSFWMARRRISDFHPATMVHHVPGPRQAVPQHAWERAFPVSPRCGGAPTCALSAVMVFAMAVDLFSLTLVSLTQMPLGHSSLFRFHSFHFFSCARSQPGFSVSCPC